MQQEIKNIRIQEREKIYRRRKMIFVRHVSIEDTEKYFKKIAHIITLF